MPDENADEPDENGTAKAATGVDGLDEILDGGLPCGEMHLVRGGPGSGKTTLALQFLLAGAARGAASGLPYIAPHRGRSPHPRADDAESPAGARGLREARTRPAGAASPALRRGPQATPAPLARCACPGPRKGGRRPPSGTGSGGSPMTASSGVVAEPTLGA